MTPSLPRPPSRTALRSTAALALLLAGCASIAASDQRDAPATPARAAIIAGPDAGPAAVRRAATGATDRGASTPAEIRRVGGLLEAQAQAAALAAEGYDVIVGVGPEAKAAVGQAQGAELGAGVRWRTAAP